MNYEQKYKQALERAKYLKENTDSVGALDVSTCFEEIFPELRESEDERIRKEIIQFLQLPHPQFVGKRNYEEWITWLEKQEEPNIEDFGEFINNLSKQFPEVSFAKLSRIAVRVKNWLEKEGEKSEYNPYKATVESIAEMCKSYSTSTDLHDFYDNARVKCKDVMEYDKTWTENQGEQKPWSEEDKKMKSLIISTLTSMGTLNLERYHHMNLDEVKNWLESIKDRVQHQPKQEWSEEDEYMIECIIAAIKMGDYYTQDELNRMTSWLKSLKSNHWRPSEEQLNAFEHFVRSIGESGYASPYDDNTKLLYSLLNDLKNL